MVASPLAATVVTAILRCDFCAAKARNLSFLQDFWRFGSIIAEIASDWDCAILVREGLAPHDQRRRDDNKNKIFAF